MKTSNYFIGILLFCASFGEALGYEEIRDPAYSEPELANYFSAWRFADFDQVPPDALVSTNLLGQIKQIESQEQPLQWRGLKLSSWETFDLPNWIMATLASNNPKIVNIDGRDCDKDWAITFKQKSTNKNLKASTFAPADFELSSCVYVSSLQIGEQSWSNIKRGTQFLSTSQAPVKALEVYFKPPIALQNLLSKDEAFTYIDHMATGTEARLTLPNTNNDYQLNVNGIMTDKHNKAIFMLVYLTRSLIDREQRLTYEQKKSNSTDMIQLGQCHYPDYTNVYLANFADGKADFYFVVNGDSTQDNLAKNCKMQRLPYELKIEKRTPMYDLTY